MSTEHPNPIPLYTGEPHTFQESLKTDTTDKYFFTPFINPLTIFECNKPLTGLQFIFLYLMIFILVSILIYIIYTTLEWVAVTIALIFTIGIIIVNPDVAQHIAKNPVIIYYCVFFMITLLFSLDRIRNNRQILLVVSLIFTAVLALYTMNSFIISVTIFFNIYVIIRIMISFINPDSDVDETPTSL